MGKLLYNFILTNQLFLMDTNQPCTRKMKVDRWSAHLSKQRSEWHQRDVVVIFFRSSNPMEKVMKHGLYNAEIFFGHQTWDFHGENLDGTSSGGFSIAIWRIPRGPEGTSARFFWNWNKQIVYDVHRKVKEHKTMIISQLLRGCSWPHKLVYDPYISTCNWISNPKK